MSDVVLDASAVLLLIFNEPGAERVRKHLDSAAISAVNLSEVVATLTEHGGPDNLLRQEVEDLGIEVIEFDAEASFVAGFLRSHTRAKGLSLGDRACLATALLLQKPAVTADRNWKGLSVGVEILFAR